MLVSWEVSATFAMGALAAGACAGGNMRLIPVEATGKTDRKGRPLYRVGGTELTRDELIQKGILLPCQGMALGDRGCSGNGNYRTGFGRRP